MLCWVWWYVLVRPATLEVEVRGSRVWGQSGKVSKTLSPKQNTNKGTGGMAQVIELLAQHAEGPGFNPLYYKIQPPPKKPQKNYCSFQKWRKPIIGLLKNFYLLEDIRLRMRLIVEKYHKYKYCASIKMLGKIKLKDWKSAVVTCLLGQRKESWTSD
jgi:hypothetical protein